VYILKIIRDPVSGRKDAEFYCPISRPMCCIFADAYLKNNRSGIIFVLYFIRLQYVRGIILVLSCRAEVNHEISIA
jgi:hypothetical protein